MQTYRNKCLIKLLSKIKGDLRTCETAASKGVSCDWLEFDLNAIFHPVAQEIYQYGNDKAIPVSLMRPHSKNHRPPPQPSEQTLFKAICERIEQIRKIINPTKGIYLATDGVAGCSKMAQQRKRRFLGILTPEKSSASNVLPKFDSNCISAGTLFMERLSKYIDVFVQIQMKNNPEWKGLEVVISNNRVNGEGEHKALQHMRRNPEFSYTIVSPDADLIFLGMGCHNPRVHIFRENIFTDISDADFFLVDISGFRQCVLEEIGMSKEIDILKVNAIIEDFIVFCMFIGNDFVPTVPSLNISADGIPTLFLMYSKVVRENGFLSTRRSDGSYTIRKEGLKAFLKEMAIQEYDMMYKTQKNNRAKFPDTIMKECISYPPVPGKFRSSGQQERILTIDLPRYKKEYYSRKFNGVDIKVITHEYLKGMLFVLKYYLTGIPSNMWCFQFHYAPFFSELYDHIDDFDTDFEFDNAPPFSPLEQLIAIIPGKNAELLPEPLRMLTTSSTSPIIDMYPIYFEVDLEGKKQEYEGICLLAPCDPERLQIAFKELEPSLSAYDRNRNRPGKIFTYTHDKTDGVIQSISNG